MNFRTPLDVMSRFFEPESDGFTTKGIAEREHFYQAWDCITELWFDRAPQFVEGRAQGPLADQLDSLEQELFASAWYREVDETVVVNPNRSPAPVFYFR
jgi:hypothetical protein